MTSGVSDGEGLGRELRKWAQGVIEELQGLSAGIGDGGDNLEVFDISYSVRAYVEFSGASGNKQRWLLTSDFQRKSWCC